MSLHFYSALHENGDSGLGRVGYLCAVAVGIGGCKYKLED